MDYAAHVIACMRCSKILNGDMLDENGRCATCGCDPESILVAGHTVVDARPRDLHIDKLDVKEE